MRIKILASVAAVALAATIGSVSASDQLTTPNGIQAATMSDAEMDAVTGAGKHTLHIHTPGTVDNGIAEVLDPGGIFDICTGADQTCRLNPRPGLSTATGGTVVHWAKHGVS